MSLWTRNGNRVGAKEDGFVNRDELEKSGRQSQRNEERKRRETWQRVQGQNMVHPYKCCTSWLKGRIVVVENAFKLDFFLPPNYIYI